MTNAVFRIAGKSMDFAASLMDPVMLRVSISLMATIVVSKTKNNSFRP